MILFMALKDTVPTYREDVLTRVQNTDWLDLARSLSAASIDLLYADPPFNAGRS